jgi:hypothetical protein
MAKEATRREKEVLELVLRMLIVFEAETRSSWERCFKNCPYAARQLEPDSWPLSACNLAPARGLPTLRCRSHIVLSPPCVSQHQHFVLTSKQLHKLSISVAIAARIVSHSLRDCMTLRGLQASNFALRIGKSLPAFDLARSRLKFQHRPTHRLRTHNQSSTPSFSRSRAFRGGLNLSKLCGAGEALHRCSLQGLSFIDALSLPQLLCLALTDHHHICSRTQSRCTINDQA